MTLVSETYEEWLDYLDTATEPQAQETLVSRWDKNGEHLPDGERAYCCLGIACLIAPGGIGDKYISSSQEFTLLPTAVADRLGLGGYWKDSHMSWDTVVASANTQVDIRLDYLYDLYPPKNNDGNVEWIVSAASLNDTGCTFKQIAQMLRYFGISEVTG